MAWELMGEEPVGFDWRTFDIPMIGDELIKIEHYFNGATFPGTGYAVLSNLYANDERDVFYRSYPKKDSERIYEINVPIQFQLSSYLLHQLQVKRNQYARVDADADWRVRAYLWFNPSDPNRELDGNPDDPNAPSIDYDGNP